MKDCRLSSLDAAKSANTALECIAWALAGALTKTSSDPFAKARTLAAQFCAVLVFAFLVAGPVEKASAQDELGQFSFSEILLEPMFEYAEPKRGRFTFGYAYAGINWERDESISGHLKLGTSNLIGTPSRYALPLNDGPVIVEAFGEIASLYGRFRAGLVPIGFGLEGGEVEASLRLPRSLLFQARWLAIRDYGVAHHISNAGFFSDLAIHNGEGGPDLDNEVWFTGRWGYQPGRYFRFGLSGVAGRTSPESTNPSGDTNRSVSGLDVNRVARIRIANAFFDLEAKPFGLQGEVSAGDTRQQGASSEDVFKMRAYHVDATYNPNEGVGWIARYDVLDPVTAQGGDFVEELTAGIAFRSRYDSSVFYILGTRRVEEGVSPNQHRVTFLWRLTPGASDLGSLL